MFSKAPFNSVTGGSAACPIRLPRDSIHVWVLSAPVNKCRPACTVDRCSPSTASGCKSLRLALNGLGQRSSVQHPGAYHLVQCCRRLQLSLSCNLRKEVTSLDTERYLLLREEHYEHRSQLRPRSYEGRAMRFLRIRHVMQLTGLSRMTIYRLELAGRFPKRRQLSKNSVAWLESDVEGWAESRPVARLRGTPYIAARPRPSGEAQRRTP